MVAGDVFQQVYQLNVPSWVPDFKHEEVIETLLGYASDIEAELKSEFASGTDIVVTSTDVVEESENQYAYIVTYRVDTVDPADEGEVKSAGIWFVVQAALVLAIIIGMAFVLRETRKLVQEPGGIFVALGGLGLGYMVMRDRRERRRSSG